MWKKCSFRTYKLFEKIRRKEKKDKEKITFIFIFLNGIRLIKSIKSIIYAVLIILMNNDIISVWFYSTRILPDNVDFFISGILCRLSWTIKRRFCFSFSFFVTSLLYCVISATPRSATSLVTVSLLSNSRPLMEATCSAHFSGSKFIKDVEISSRVKKFAFLFVTKSERSRSLHEFRQFLHVTSTTTRMWGLSSNFWTQTFCFYEVIKYFV